MTQETQSRESQDEELVDFDAMSMYFAGDEEILLTVIEKYLSTSGVTIQAIEQAIETADFPQVRMLAHKLRGGVSVFFVKKIEEDLLALELGARDGKLQGVGEIFAKVLTQLKALESVLRSYSMRKGA